MIKNFIIIYQFFVISSAQYCLCPQEGQVKYFLFALSSRRKAYSHFYCRSSNLVSLKDVLMSHRER